MEELRLALLVMGGCAIAAILAHGLWSIRKNAAEKDKPGPSYQPRDWDYDDQDFQTSEDESEQDIVDVDLGDNEDKLEPKFQVDEDDNISQQDEYDNHKGYDDLGLGEVRVVSATNTVEKERKADLEDKVSVSVESTQAKPDSQTDYDAPKIYSSVVTQPKPEYVSQQRVSDPTTGAAKSSKSDWSASDIPEPPSSLLKKNAEDKPAPVTSPASQQAEPEKASVLTQAKEAMRKKAESGARKRRDPKIREDQMRIDFDEPVVETEGPAKSDKSTAPVEQEVLVLNVKVPDEQPILGSALLPMLLTLGFKFGDQDIFHRHVNSNGKGPVLFSLANMFKPGVFDIDNLETFTTQGISLFMILPIEGDPHQVFNMMHNAARKIADEFSGQVIDGRRTPLNKQSLQQYVEKIREFERKRLLR